MEIKNKYICRAVYKPTGQVFYAGTKGTWYEQVNKANVFSSSGAGQRVNSMNRNDNWEAKKVRVAIKIMED
jgi:hypothetical protein